MISVPIINCGSQGQSAVWICVNRDYNEPDISLPLLEILLAKGFDTNAVVRNMSALHSALFFAHQQCALAMARAGANLQIVCRDFTTSEEEEPVYWTELQAYKAMYGVEFARQLVQASVTAAAGQKDAGERAVGAAQRGLDDIKIQDCENVTMAAKATLESENEHPNRLLKVNSSIKDVQKSERVVKTEARCETCGTRNPAKSCPCGRVHYCDRTCQRSGWKQHKQVCTFKSE